MKIFGHPIHIMLVHFPSALFPMNIVFSAINFYTGDLSFINASFYVMCGGVIFGWLAAAFGAFDLINIFEKKPEAMNKALLHGGINLIVVIIYTVLAALQYRQYPFLKGDTILMLISKVAIVSFMIIGNFMGGSLILKNKVADE